MASTIRAFPISAWSSWGELPVSNYTTITWKDSTQNRVTIPRVPGHHCHLVAFIVRASCCHCLQTTHSSGTWTSNMATQTDGKDFPFCLFLLSGQRDLKRRSTASSRPCPLKSTWTFRFLWKVPGHTYIYIYVWICACECRCPQSSKRGGSPGAGITGSCNLPYIEAWEPNLSPHQSSKPSSSWTLEFLRFNCSQEFRTDFVLTVSSSPIPGLPSPRFYPAGQLSLPWPHFWAIPFSKLNVRHALYLDLGV